MTSYGPSEEAVKSTPESPLDGLGQKATDAPPNWTLVSSPYQKAYTVYCQGCTLKNPTGSIV
eukprot:7356126-Ditylum_brightwellii.AAC.1